MYHTSTFSSILYHQMMGAVESVAAVKSVFISLMRDIKLRKIDFSFLGFLLAIKCDILCLLKYF